MIYPRVAVLERLHLAALDLSLKVFRFQGVFKAHNLVKSQDSLRANIRGIGRRISYVKL
jgi:hypothetical protein